MQETQKSQLHLPKAIVELSTLRFSRISSIHHFNQQLNKVSLTKRRSKIDENETWGCQYLEPEYQALLSQGIDPIIGAIAYKSKYQLKSHTALRQFPKENFANIKVVMDELKEEAPKFARLKIDVDYFSFFGKEPEWLAMEQAALNAQGLNKLLMNKEERAKENNLKAKIQAIKTQWEQDKTLCLYSSSALLYMLEHIVLVLPHVKAAKKELRRHRRKMPSMIVSEYGCYLNQLDTHLSALKKAILDSITVRLKLADRYSANPMKQHDDVLVDVLEKLKMIKALPAHTHIPTSPVKFDKDTMPNFIAALYQHGTAEQKDVMYSLQWFKDKPECYIADNILQFTWKLVSRKLFKSETLPGIPYIIPETLKEKLAIPQFKVWPRWLAKDHNACADFIKHHQVLFCTLGSSLSTYLSYDSINILINTINYLTESQKKLGEIKRQGKQHQKYISSTLNLIRAKQYEAKKHLVEQIESMVILEVTPLEHRDCDKRWQELYEMFEQVNNIITPQDDLLSIRLNTAKQRLLNKLQQTPETILFEGVYHLSKGKLLPKDDMEACVDYLSNFCLGEDKNAAQILSDFRKEDCQPLMEKAANTLFIHLKQQLNVFIFSDEPIKQYQLFLELSTAEQRAKWQRMIRCKIQVALDDLLKHEDSSVLDKHICALDIFVNRFGDQSSITMLNHLTLSRETNNHDVFRQDVMSIRNQLATDKVHHYLSKEGQRAERTFSKYVAKTTQDERAQQFVENLTYELTDIKAIHQLPYEKKAIVENLQKTHGDAFIDTIQTMSDIRQKTEAIKSASPETKCNELLSLHHQVKSISLFSSFYKKAPQMLSQLEVSQYARTKENNYTI